MPSQPTLRPFDVAVALRLLLVPRERYVPLAGALATSTSAVHRSVARLQHARLCQPFTREVNCPAFREFLVYGVRYAFPPIHGPERAGIATAASHPALAVLLADQSLPPLVWPAANGRERGESLVPLFAGAPKVASGEAPLYELLACVDVLRVGNEAQVDMVIAHVEQLTNLAA